MDNYNKSEIIKALDKRKIRLHFSRFPVVLYFKGKKDSEKKAVPYEINRYHSTFVKFVEEEYRNLISVIYPSIIEVKTSEERIASAKLELEKGSDEHKTYADERKQKREQARCRARNDALAKEYKETIAIVNEETAFIETTLDIVIRLCLSAYHYTISCLSNYLKYVEGDYDPIFKEITYEKLYDDFTCLIGKERIHEDEI